MSRRTPVARAAAIGAAVVVVDLTTKMIAVALLGTRTIPLPGGAFFEVVYNDAFARGISLGAWSMPATVLLAVALIWLLVRVCAELADIDGGAPIALGLIGGATAANAADFARSGRGVVDFLGVAGTEGGIVFNLADVAAYVGVALLARTGLRLASAVAAERAVTSRRVELALDAAFDGTAGTTAAPQAAAAAAPATRGVRPSRRRPGTMPLEMPHGIPVFRDGVLADTERPAAPESVVLRFPSSIDGGARAGGRAADGEAELR